MASGAVLIWLTWSRAGWPSAVSTSTTTRLLKRRVSWRCHVMVRSCVVESEREQDRQSRRRLALVLAADFGIDLDEQVIGAKAVA